MADSGATRVMVRGLPPYVTKERLREVFGEVGEVTDAKVMKTSSGKSRCFGFVGFKSARHATQALKRFDKTYLDTAKLAVCIAKPAGDSDLSRPWSRYSRGSSKHRDSNPEMYLDEATGEAAAADGGGASGRGTKRKGATAAMSDQKRKKLAEFFEVMRGRDKARVWENDAVASGLAGGDAPAPAAAAAAAVAAVAAPGASDLDYLRSKVDPVVDAETKAAAAAEASAASPSSLASSAAAATAAASTTAETARLFVRNLAFTCTEADLEAAFQKFGALVEVRIPVDKARRPKGFAYVAFESVQGSVRALSALDGTVFQGRLLHVMPAKTKPEERAWRPAVAAGAERTSEFKQKRDSKLREQAADPARWNSLYMRSDTVVTAVAHQMGVAKSAVLDRDAASMAVQLALSETHAIAQTKRDLEANGIDIEVLESLQKRQSSGKAIVRSATVLLVKNLPFESTEEELRQLFGAHGDIGVVVITTTRAIAVVEFMDASCARRAFAALAYTRFRDSPLYLEWAPADLLRATPATAAAAATTAKGAAAATSVAPSSDAAQREEDDDADDDDDDDAVAQRTLFVKNINFKTTEAMLTAALKQGGVGGIKSIKLATKPNPAGGAAGKTRMSMGYAFIQFESKKAAAGALRMHQNLLVDGHALNFQRSQAKKRSAGRDMSRKPSSIKASATSSATCTKLAVKNIAFEATRKELRELFGSFGPLKSVRLPRKFDGAHRGFAFVEFTTKHDSQTAFDALSSTHLYGRRLVIEWAESTQELDAARAKAMKDMLMVTGGN
tara:strand:- start:42 stop:2402 length:2361 start_codon:yes stop_codon:yes gene_type:complete